MGRRSERETKALGSHRMEEIEPWDSRDWWRPDVVVQFGITGGRPAIVKLWLDLDKLNIISLDSDSSWASLPALEKPQATLWSVKPSAVRLQEYYRLQLTMH